MNATNALDEILRAANRADESPVTAVPVIINGKCIVVLDDGSRVQLTARVISEGKRT